PGSAVRAVLRGRGLSSELSGEPHRPALHRLQRPAQAETVAAAVPDALPGIVDHESPRDRGATFSRRATRSMPSSATSAAQYNRPVIGKATVLTHSAGTASAAACRILSTTNQTPRKPVPY